MYGYFISITQGRLLTLVYRIYILISVHPVYRDARTCFHSSVHVYELQHTLKTVLSSRHDTTQPPSLWAMSHQCKVSLRYVLLCG